MICSNTLQASSSLIFFFLTMQSKSQPLSMYYITRNRCLGVSIISYNWMILGCRMSLSMWISRATLSTSATSMILSFSRILIATFSPLGMCMPSLTLPKVPLPKVLSWLINGLPMMQLPMRFSDRVWLLGCYDAIMYNITMIISPYLHIHTCQQLMYHENKLLVFKIEIICSCYPTRSTHSLFCTRRRYFPPSFLTQSQAFVCPLVSCSMVLDFVQFCNDLFLIVCLFSIAF